MDPCRLCIISYKRSLILILENQAIGLLGKSFGEDFFGEPLPAVVCILITDIDVEELVIFGGAVVLAEEKLPGNAASRKDYQQVVHEIQRIVLIVIGIPFYIEVNRPWHIGGPAHNILLTIVVYRIYPVGCRRILGIGGYGPQLPLVIGEHGGFGKRAGRCLAGKVPRKVAGAIVLQVVMIPPGGTIG